MTSRVSKDAVAVVQNLPVAAISTPTLSVKNDKGLRKKYSSTFYKPPPTNATIADSVFLFDVCCTPKLPPMAAFGKEYDTTSDTNTCGFIPTSASPNLPVPVLSSFFKTITNESLRKEYLKQMTLDMYYFTGVSGGNYDATIGLGQSTDNAGFPVFVRGYSTVPLEKLKPNTPDYNFCEPLCVNISDVTDDDERSAMNDKRFSYGSCFPFTLAPFDSKDLMMSVLASTKHYSYYRHMALANKLNATAQLEIEENNFLKRQFSVANKVENGLLGLTLLILNCLGRTEDGAYILIDDALKDYKPRFNKPEQSSSRGRSNEGEEEDEERDDGTLYGRIFEGDADTDNDEDRRKLLKLFSMKLLDTIEKIEIDKRNSESDEVEVKDIALADAYSPFSQKRMVYSMTSLVDGLGEQFQLRAPVAHYMGRNNAIFPDGSIRTECQIKY
jgi:hypothetical protein